MLKKTANERVFKSTSREFVYKLSLGLLLNLLCFLFHKLSLESKNTLRMEQQLSY